MIWHEISQGIELAKWKRDYPYMYVHVDITFDLLATFARYVHTTGDTAFLRQNASISRLLTATANPSSKGTRLCRASLPDWKAATSRTGCATTSRSPPSGSLPRKLLECPA